MRIYSSIWHLKSLHRGQLGDGTNHTFKQDSMGAQCQYDIQPSLNWMRCSSWNRLSTIRAQGGLAVKGALAGNKIQSDEWYAFQGSGTSDEYFMATHSRGGVCRLYLPNMSSVQTCRLSIRVRRCSREAEALHQSGPCLLHMIPVAHVINYGQRGLYK